MRIQIHAAVRPYPIVVAVAFVLVTSAAAADFATPGGPAPADIETVADLLRENPYDLELLISFGTSKGGSAGHLALAIREPGSRDETVYSANFYADRAPEHAGRYTADLMTRIPKTEYLFRTTSSLGDRASFGLDFGEIYKRSVVGVRVYGVPAAEKSALAAYFQRINRDYHDRAARTEYHDGEVKYDYLRLNCAKTIGSAFKFGAGYKDLEVTSAKILPALTRAVAALHANIPTEMAMKLVREWNARGYGMDVVLYKKYPGSAYVDPHEEEKVAFQDLPNRFPSVLSRDFRREEGRYEDFDNLYAMYLLYNLGRFTVRVNENTQALEIDSSKTPMAYPQAAELARRNAKADSDSFPLRLPFLPSGIGIGDGAEPVRLNTFSDGPLPR